MQLKTLQVAGFKSFADKTKIHFDTGLTGIVGPNGSGKSNVTEAIRWAMGEQSAKNLRGDKMPDIIFAGTDLRTPMNHAEVTLIFDNQDQYLKNQPENVEITRRLFRDGQSDFLINQKNCRLKDIVNLFMDSGLGRESFSIISQGRVEAIFKSKPEDRRAIIEEAAGVLKYKQQKKQATEQLDQTDLNLNRINDILNELQSRVEPLRQQSSIAQDYLTQKSQYDQLQKQLLVIEIQQYQASQESALVQKNQLETALHRIQQTIAENEQAQTTIATDLAACEQTLETAQQQLVEQSRLNEQLIGQENVDQERLINNQNSVANLKAEIQVLTDKKAALDQAKQVLQQDVNTKALQLKNVDEQLVQLTQDVDTSQDKLQEKIADLQQAYIDQMQAQTSNRNEQNYLEKTLQQQEQQLKKQQTQLQQNQSGVSDKQAKQKQLAIKVDQLKADLQAVEKQQQACQNEIQKLQKAYQDAQNNWFEATGIIQQAKAKHTSLVELSEDHAGFYQGVKAILSQQAKLPGIIGAVAELITVPAKFQNAIELALGAQLQQVVTKDENSAKQAIRYLKQQRLGRATFLPNAVIKPRVLPQGLHQQLQQQVGFLGIASQLIDYEQNIENVVGSLLGQLLVVTDLDAGLNIAQLTNRRYKIVTLDGDILNPGGAMTGGQSKTNNNSLLSRKQTIADLAIKIQQMQTQLLQKEQEVKQLKQQGQQAQQQQQQLQQQSQQANQAYQQAANELTLLNEQLQRVQLQKNADDYQQQQQTAEFKANQQKQIQLSQQATEITNQLEQYQQSIKETQERLADYANQQTKLNEKRQKLQTQQAVSKHDYENATALVTAKQQQLDEVKQSLQAKQTQLDALTTHRQQSQMSQQQRQAKLTATTAKIAALQTEITTEKTKKNQLQAANQECQQVLSRTYQLQKKTLTEQETNTVLLDRCHQAIASRLNELSETFELTFEAANQQIEAQQIDIEQTKLKLKLLKRGLSELGTVNLGAIDEYETVKSRFEFLSQQAQDLLDAKQQLLGTINEIDETVAQRFKTTFDQTAQAFSEIFPLMFGGGHASLTLTDPTALLTSGIDIIAQPPGKKLQRLSLLSGGEKALTAITLLFAILKVKPVPFCILDEVEASLDDANVDRFGQFMKRYEGKTQFIVITHRKGTMTQANRLYGVTMEESGVSKLVSVSLSEVS